MSERISNDNVSSGRSWKDLQVLVVAALVAPHTMEFSRVILMDSSYTRFSFAAAFWTLIHEEGSAFPGPYSSTLFPLPNELTLLWTVLFFPLYLCIIYTQWRFIRCMTTKSKVLRVIAATLVIQLVILMTFFSYSLDGWASVAAFPLPVFHMLSVRLVHRHSEPEQTD